MRKIVFYIFLSLSFLDLPAQKNFTVHADRIIGDVSPTMWGLFFEDINFGADGGLYAELVKNRSFEFSTPMMGWKELKNKSDGKILIVNLGNKRPSNPRYASITVNSSQPSYGLSNDGFRGMGVKPGMYDFSADVRSIQGNVSIDIELVNSSGKILGTARLNDFSSSWKNQKVSFSVNDTASAARLNLQFSGTGKIDIDMVSLFPRATWKNRPKGLRADLVQLLADMKPGFLRFPGGCIVEGKDLQNRYQWKTTVGAVAERQVLMNRWNVEFRHRPTPDYFQTFGLGFFEYFQLSEDIGAAPLPILNCGMACQYNTGEVVAMNDLDPYVQDALDLIEFANGSVSTKWGKLRSDMGHAKPFNLKYIGIGNEQWDVQYVERFKEFEKVLKKKHPGIQLVAAAGPSADGPRFDYAWKEFKALNVDLIDEHYYQEPAWFLGNANRYDNYERTGPKVFAGEYAAQSRGIANSENRNNWICALAEAAFMTGLERNADVVRMASYAPLFAHVDAWQWTPDLIWFDNLSAYGTPNYYVQKLFAVNRGTDLIRITDENKQIAGKDSIYASAVIDRPAKTLIIKLVNAASATATTIIDLQDLSASDQAASIELMTADRSATNSIKSPIAISPVLQQVRTDGNKMNTTMPPLSFQVIRIPLK